MPIWLQRLCIVFFAAAYLYFGILPLLTKRSPPGLTWLVSKVSRGAEKLPAAATEGIYFKFNNFSNSASERIGTASSFALSYFEPGSVPTTT